MTPKKLIRYYSAIQRRFPTQTSIQSPMSDSPLDYSSFPRADSFLYMITQICSYSPRFSWEMWKDRAFRCRTDKYNSVSLSTQLDSKDCCIDSNNINCNYSNYNWSNNNKQYLQRKYKNNHSCSSNKFKNRSNSFRLSKESAMSWEN